MNGKRYIDALPYCACGCGRKVNKFRSKYLPGHHMRGLKGEKTSFYGKTHKKFARLAISEGLKKRNEKNNGSENELKDIDRKMILMSEKIDLQIGKP